jgi:peptidoglycan/LPS O-acetylase OafA/YrhL
MTALYIITAAALAASLIADRRKTLQALKVAGKRFLRLLPAFLSMLCLVAIALTLLPREVLFRYLGGEGIWSTAGIAALLGSVTLMPGFIAFPLSGLLLKEGAAYLVLAAFTTTLMMVGVVTFPIEKQYLGVKTAIIRNFISLAIALAVSAAIGLYFGELP